MGYSMGARIVAYLALAHPQRVRSAVFGGLGFHLVGEGGIGGLGPSETIARGVGGASLADVTDPTARLVSKLR